MVDRRRFSAKKRKNIYTKEQEVKNRDNLVVP